MSMHGAPSNPALEAWQTAAALSEQGPGQKSAQAAEQEPDPIRQIADAVLYEGYILWPYSRAATKNQRRWTFGGVYPSAHSEGRDDDPCEMRTECLVEGGADTRVEVRVRFLHVVERTVMRLGADGLEPVDELTIAGRRHLSWDEAVEREIVVGALSPFATGAADFEQAADGAEAEPAVDGHAQSEPIEIPAGSDSEQLLDDDGEQAGAIVRRWRSLAGSVEVSAETVRAEADGAQPESGATSPEAGTTRPGAGPNGRAVARLSVRIHNASPFEPGDREQALKQTFVSTHTAMRADDGAFVSQTDPPDELRKLADGCENRGTWPVLVGAPGERQRLLSSPIILSDHPEIAPESPGDLFDGAEIDGLLTLSILSLTEEERREMRDSDPRAREILERTEALSEEELMRLHGAMREFQAARHP